MQSVKVISFRVGPPNTVFWSACFIIFIVASGYSCNMGNTIGLRVFSKWCQGPNFELNLSWKLGKEFKGIRRYSSFSCLLNTLMLHKVSSWRMCRLKFSFWSFKPNPKVYLGTGEKMGEKPEECGLVVAHLNNLKGAKARGFWTIYLDRPLEKEKIQSYERETFRAYGLKRTSMGWLLLLSV